MQFTLMFLWGALITLLGVSAVPVDDSDPVTNICAWVGAIPELYTEYSTDVCPPKHHLEEDGKACSDYRNYENDCGAYCELRTNFRYGPEQPFLRIPLCRGPRDCKIEYGISQTYAYKAGANTVLKSRPLIAGIAGGYNQEYSKGISNELSTKLGQGECGYFSFVGILRDTCGTYTEVSTGLTSCGSMSPSTVENACVQQVARFKASDGHPDEDVTRGIVIFVRTDCDLLDPLPEDLQSPVYREPDVKLDRGAIQQGYADWMRKDIDAFTAGSTTCSSDKKTTRGDCLNAVGQMLDAPLSEIPDGKKGDHIDITSYGNCKISYEYVDDIKDSCGADTISWVELAAAAQGIHDNCPDGKGHVGGKHRVGTKCKGTVVMTVK